MKTTYKLFACVIASFICLLLLYNTVFTESYMNITYPKGGEILKAGDTTVIKWNADSAISTIDINLWNGYSGTFTQIANTVTASSGSYTWVVPNTQISGICRVKAAYYDSLLGTNTFSPAYFSIELQGSQKASIYEPDENNSEEQKTINKSESFSDILKLFPNPAKNAVTLSWENTADVENIIILDQTGRECIKVDTKKIKSPTSLDISKLTAGAYIIILEFKDYTRIRGTMMVN